jgi:Protein of unknown function (DUF3305)
MNDPLAVDAAWVPARNESVPLGVVFERRRIDHPWQQWRWAPVAVIPGAVAPGEPKLLRRGEGWAWFLVASLPLDLYPRETGDYRVNLSQTPPQIYVLWRGEAAGAEDWPEPFLATVCPSETRDYLDGGDVMAEGVPMPEAVADLLRAYVRAYHVDVPFRKRKRTPLAPQADGGEEGG